MDYLDTDSDNDGIDDAVEAGHGETLASIEASADTDGDGLKDVVEGADADDGYDVNDENVDSEGNIVLTDTDEDVAEDRSNVEPLNIDYDYRELPDNDGDNINDLQDIDDDNDGILDVDEGGFIDGPSGAYTWTHNLDGGRSTAGNHNEFGPGAQHAVASSGDAILGAGLTELQANGQPASGGNGMTFEFHIDGATSTTLDEARDNEHYVDCLLYTSPSPRD